MKISEKGVALLLLLFECQIDIINAVLVVLFKEPNGLGYYLEQNTT